SFLRRIPYKSLSILSLHWFATLLKCPRAAIRSIRSLAPTPTQMAVLPDLQKNLNGEVHDWYRIILGFPDRLVTELLNRFQIQRHQLVLDPFCGAGTTLVECMKLGINSIGIDANPS